MKVKVPLFLLLMLAAALGYLLGTEKGRRRRDQMVVMVRERRGGVGSPESSREVADEPSDAERPADAAETAATSVHEPEIAPVS